MKARSAVLILRANKVLLIERKTSIEPVYYVLPGGGIEEGETPEQAAIREMREELGVGIEIKSKQKDPLQTDRETWIIRAELKGGAEPKWLEQNKQTSDSSYAVIWLPKDKLKGLRVFPKSLNRISLI